MERAITVFIGAAAAAGFLYGLLFTQSRVLPALGGAAIFGVTALLLVAVLSVAGEALRSARARRAARLQGPHRPA